MTAYYFLYSTLHITTMLLFMTFNGGVVIALMLGMAIAYILYGNQDEDSDLAVNCCANSA